MSNKNDQLVRLVEAIVRKEMKRVLPTILPKLIKESLAGIIMESHVTMEPDDIDVVDNSHKRRTLMESTSGYEPYPTMPITRNEIAQNFRASHGAAGRENLNIPTKALTESGNQIPIPPEAVPDFIIRAMNKNYSQDLKTVNSLAPNFRNNGY